MRLAKHCLWLVVLPLVLTGCPAKNPAARTPSEQPSTPSTTGSQSTGTALTVTDDAGKPVLLVAKETDKYKVSDAKGEIGTLKEEIGKLNIADASGAKVGSVKQSEGDYTLDDKDGQKLMKFKSKEGGYRLKDTSDTMLLKIKPKDDGFKVSDGSDNALAKGKKKGDTIVVSNEAGTVLYKVSGSMSPLPTGLLVYEKLSPLQKAALITAASQ